MTSPATAAPPHAVATSRAVGHAALRWWPARLGPSLGLLIVVAVCAALGDAPARYLAAFNLRMTLSQTAVVALGRSA